MVAIVATLGLECTVIPGVVEERAFVTLWQPQSGVYRALRARLDTSDWYFPGTHPADTPWRSCQVTLEDWNRQRYTIVVNLDDNTFHEDGEATVRRRVTAKNLLVWLADAGVDTARAGLEAEIAVIEELIAKANAPGALFAKQGRQVSATGISRSSWGHGPSSPKPLLNAGIDISAFGDARASYEQRLGGSPVIEEALLVIIGAVWLFGIWRILRTKRASDTSDDATTAER